jgi:Ctr copper transporter family
MRRFPLIHPAIVLAAAASLARTLAQREETIERLQTSSPLQDVERPRSFDPNSPNPLQFTSPDMTDHNGTSFCDNSMTMSMFVDGFHSSLLSVTSSSSSSSQGLVPADDTSSDPPESSSSSPAPLPSCLSYLSPTFELSSPGRFALAMLASFLMAVLLEALTALKCNVSCHGVVFSKKKRRRSADAQAQPSGTTIHDVQRFGPRQRRALMTLIYALQGLLGFLIMLVTMAYSVELLASVVAGLMVGNAAFGSVVTPSCRRRCSSITTTTTTHAVPPAASAVPPRIRHGVRETPVSEPESSLSPLLQPLLSTQNDQSFVV